MLFAFFFLCFFGVLNVSFSEVKFTQYKTKPFKANFNRYIILCNYPS